LTIAFLSWFSTWRAAQRPSVGAGAPPQQSAQPGPRDAPDARVRRHLFVKVLQRQLGRCGRRGAQEHARHAQHHDRPRHHLCLQCLCVSTRGVTNLSTETFFVFFATNPALPRTLFRACRQASWQSGVAGGVTQVCHRADCCPRPAGSPACVCVHARVRRPVVPALPRASLRCRVRACVRACVRAWLGAAPGAVGARTLRAAPVRRVALRAGD
jgi:hypothetical protein